jgi:hypothetical protein
LSLFKKFSTVSAAVAFLRSPTGQQMVGKVKQAVTDPRNRAKAAELAAKIRRPAVDRP